MPVIQRGDNHPDLFFPNGGESGPDAHLIATAPDLLKLAEHVASLNPDAGEIGPGMLRQIIEEAEAALAKANGNENPNGE